MTDHNKNQDPKSQSPKSETDVIDEALDSVGLEDEAVQAGAGTDPLAKRVLELEEEIAKA